MIPARGCCISLFVLVLCFCFQSSHSFRVPPSRNANRPNRAHSIAARDDAATNLDACGQLVVKYNNDGTTQFTAREAYECLKIVPFNATIARDFLGYCKGTYEFQSTLAYLRNPPSSYQQPAVDVLEALGAIGQNIDIGLYTNEYTFEADLKRVINRIRDAHTTFDAGLLHVFSFGSPVTIVALSKDGVEYPKPYLSTDVIGNDGSIPASPISRINGQNATTFLIRYAQLHSTGNLEPHGDWNNLMDTPALTIQNGFSSFDSYSSFYPGDLLNIQLGNGTSLPQMHFQAIANFESDLSNVTSAQDFYNFFVPLNSAIQDEETAADDDDDDDDDDNSSETTSSESPTPTSTSDAVTSTTDTTSATQPTDTNTTDDQTENNWSAISSTNAYPAQPEIAQPNLGYGGWITGYFLNATSTGVLSIPSFELSNEGLSSFSDTIDAFISRAKQAGMERIVIDLQQNFGGAELLAIDAFKHFFPDATIPGASRLRAFDKSDTLGNTLTPYMRNITADPTIANQSYVETALDDPWAVLNYINANTHRYYDTWGEFFGPIPDHGDSFSTCSQFNYSDIRFDQGASANDPNEEVDNDDGDESASSSSGPVFVPYGFSGNSSQSGPPPYDAKDIVILTDTACSSTCAMFVELMHHVGGVRTVAVGGLPQPGPIQAAGGTRGAELYGNFDIDSDMYVVSALNDTAGEILGHNARANINFTITYLSFNLRDQIRQGENFPLQFAYDAADCRLFWTMASLNNYTDLWTRAATAIFDNPDLCVPDSTGYTRDYTDQQGPSAAAKEAWANGLTIAQMAQALQANATASTASVKNDSSTMAAYILGGIGGSLKDSGGNRWGIASHNSNNKTAKNICAGCAQDERCVYEVECDPKQKAFDLKNAQLVCLPTCGGPKNCNGSKYKTCNKQAVACSSQSSCPTTAFCEKYAQTACNSAALKSAHKQLGNQDFDHSYVFNVGPGVQL